MLDAVLWIVIFIYFDIRIFIVYMNNREIFKQKHSTIKKTSPSGNRTPVARVTGGNTHHYTNEDCMKTNYSAYKLNLLENVLKLKPTFLQNNKF